MKQQLLVLALVLGSVTAFSQTKPKTKPPVKTETKADSVKPVPPTVAPAQPVRQFLLVLGEQEWQNLFYWLGTSGELTSIDAKKYIQVLNSQLREIPQAPSLPVQAADSAKKKYKG